MGEECVLTELNQLLTSTGGGRVVDLGCRRSLITCMSNIYYVFNFGESAGES